MERTQSIASNGNSLRASSIATGMVCLAAMSNPASAAQEPAPGVKTQAQSNYGNLPLSFEANQGQTDAQVKFLARGQGYALFLTPTEAVLSLQEPQAQAKTFPLTKSPPSPKAIGPVLRMQLPGANPAAWIQGKDALSGKVNYLIGRDESQWHTQMPTYGKVVYEGVYPGVDLVYYGTQGQLEYDFVLAPGADPNQIKVAFRGTDDIAVNSAGELVLRAKDSELRLRKPVLYQEIDGVRKPIDGGYVLMNGRQVGFQVAAYDPARALIIDPVLVYSTYLGGTELDGGLSIAVDRQGRAYVAGQTVSTDFPTENAIQPDFGGGGGDFGDAFVVQLTADGSALRYATYLGGEGFDQGRGIAVDQRGQAYVTGATESSDFPVVNALQPSFNNFQDAFVAQLTADGSALRYSTYLGGSEGDFGADIAVDQRGRAYVTGLTSSTDFPTVNALQPNLGGGTDSDIFVVQFTADGAALRYATYLGGSGSDVGLGIAVDRRGQAYVTGETQSSDFPTENAFQSTFGGGVTDAFVAQLTADGSALRYATYLGGGEHDGGSSIAVNQQGQAYVAGATQSSDFPTLNALQPVLAGFSDAFVVQFRADGAALRYATYLGGSGGESAGGIALDRRGQAHVTGTTQSPDFPVLNAPQPVLSGFSDAFVAQFTSNGSTLRYATYLGGSGGEFGSDIAVDRHGQAYVTGETSSPDFPTKNALQPTSPGGSPFNAFITKIGNDDRHVNLGRNIRTIIKKIPKNTAPKIHAPHANRH
jgi:hypothetical protein